MPAPKPTYIGRGICVEYLPIKEDGKGEGLLQIWLAYDPAHASRLSAMYIGMDEIDKLHEFIEQIALWKATGEGATPPF